MIVPAWVLLISIAVGFAGANHHEHSILPCEGLVHHFFDGTSCKICNRQPCGVGLFRETCTESSIQDAECRECKPPPSPNAVHTTGGLPYMEDNCMWACSDGFYKTNTNDGGQCVQCSTEACPAGMLRGLCPLGSNRDAGCVCPIDSYIGPDGASCVPCAYTECTEADDTLMRCVGTETSDTSECVSPSSLEWEHHHKDIQGQRRNMEIHAATNPDR